MNERLSTLKKSITDMNLEELREHVRQIRADRKITKVRAADKKVRAKASDKAKGTAKKAIAKMGADELEALIRELEGDVS